MKINPRFWKVLNWTIVAIFSVLCLLSVAETIKDYISRKSNFSKEAIPIKEHPSVSICFGEKKGTLWDRDSYTLDQIDVIYYAAKKNNFTKIALKLGDNVSPDFPGEIITLRKMQRCYSILVKSDKRETGGARYVKVVMKDHDFNWFNTAPAYFYLTDPANAYGTENEMFFEGKAFPVRMILDVVSILTVQPKMTKILKEKTNCREEPVWTTFEPLFVPEVKRKCPNPCFPQGLPNETLALCNTKEDWECANRAMKKLLKNGQKVDTGPPCTKLEYEFRLNKYHSLDSLAADDPVCNKLKMYLYENLVQATLCKR